MSTDSAAATAKDVLRRVKAFEAEMRRQRIHVGVSSGPSPVTCVTCGLPWPCPGSKESQ
jgi:hypothetical protein